MHRCVVRIGYHAGNIAVRHFSPVATGGTAEAKYMGPRSIVPIECNTNIHFKTVHWMIHSKYHFCRFFGRSVLVVKEGDKGLKFTRREFIFSVAVSQLILRRSLDLF